MSFYNKDSNLRLSDAMLLRGSIISLKDPIMTTMESKESNSGLGDEMLIQLNQSNYLSGNGDSQLDISGTSGGKISKMQMRKQMKKSQDGKLSQSHQSKESRKINESIFKTPLITDHTDEQTNKEGLINIINEQDYFSPNFANLAEQRQKSQMYRRQSEKERTTYVHILNSSSNEKFTTNRGRQLTKLPGVFYRLIGEFLGEKLPTILFTCRICFKMSISFQIEFYEKQRINIQYQVNQIN